MKALLASALLLASTAVYAADPAIGKKAPNFTLADINGKTVSLADYKGKYVVLEWINHGCPFVKKHYETNNMQGLQKELSGSGVVWLSIASSAKGKEGYMDSAGWQKQVAGDGSAANAVLLDEKGKVGRLYGAKTTPHMFVINPDGNLIYKGAIDDKPTYDKADVAGSKNYVKAAVGESMEGKPVSMAETKAYGCSVKYN